jgi:DNA-binding MarR family transcriptional regulator
VPAGGHVNVALQVFRVSHLVGRALDEILEPVGLDADEFAILSVLRGEQPVQARELAAVLKIPATSLNTRLAKFERRGFVRTREDKSAGRTKLVELTAFGDRKVRACGPIFVDFIRTIEARLGPQLRQVQDALGELELVLEQHAAEPVPDSVKPA